MTAFNACTGEYPYWISTGGEILSGNEFTLSPGLGGATFTASLEVIDSVTLMPVTLEFDVVLEGAERLSHHNSGFTDWIEGQQVSGHEVGRYRGTSATATVTMDGQDVLPTQFDYALVGESRTTAHNVNH